MRMKDKIRDCFDRLQGLAIAPTLDNMEKLLQTLYDLREVYAELEKKEAEENERNQADPG